MEGEKEECREGEGRVECLRLKITVRAVRAVSADAIKKAGKAAIGEEK